MNLNYTEAAKEVATQAPDGVVMLETLNVWHPLAGAISLVNDRTDFLGDTDNGQILFKASSFNLRLPQQDDKGVAFINVTFSNVLGNGTDFLQKIPVENPVPIKMEYRIYLNNQNPPVQGCDTLTLNVTNVEINPFQVTCRAQFKNIVNQAYPAEKYNLETFPALGN